MAQGLGTLPTGSAVGYSRIRKRRNKTRPLVKKRSDANYEMYIKERNFLMGLLNEQSRHFDLRILSLSAAAIGLLVFVIRDSSTIVSALFVVCCGLFGLAIILTLGSFLISQEEIKDLIWELDDKDGSRPVGWTTKLNRASFFVFCTSVIVMGVFLYRHFTG